MYLENIYSPEDVKKLSIEELNKLSSEIRAALLQKLSEHGGHFGPNFGMVETTIALHYVFNSPKDKIVFDVSHQSYVHKMLTGRKDAFLNPANNAAFELTAGLTYHFKTSNGTHHFAKVRVYNQAEIDGLNSSINALRADVNNKDGEISNANQRINGLQEELEACRTKVVPVETVVKTARVPESIITFRQGKSSVDASQLPNVERVASYLKKYADSKVVIKGYASPEGSVEVNARIAAARAEAVKTILVNKYKISASRITAEGQGVGDMFTEPDWNRVSICTIED